MAKVSITYVVYNRQRQSDGRYPIKLRFTYNRRPTLVSTSLFADDSDLQSIKKGEEKKSRIIRETYLRRKIEDLIRRYEDAANEFDPYLFPDWTVTDVVHYLDKIVHKDTFRLDFPDFITSFAEKKEQTSHQSALNYIAAKKILCSFFGRDHFDISLITSSKMRDFEAYLVIKFGRNARAVSLYTSAIAAVHKAARKKYNSEEMGEVLIKNPFDYYTPPKQPVSDHRDAPIEIIQGMINNYQSLKGQQRLAIGVFLLSLATMGTNTPDLYECTKSGKDIIHYYRLKTRQRRRDKAEMYIKLPNCIYPLLQEYSNKSRDDKHAFNFYLRYSSYRNMQDAEKDGMTAYKKFINYEGKLTNYSARHSWATIARSAQCGIDIALIDDCLCHSNGHPLGDLYAKKDFSVLWEANEKVLAQFSWAPLAKHSEKE